MDGKRENKGHISYFHDTVVDISKIISDNEKTQENIQIGMYSITGAITGLAFFNSNKKSEKSNK